MEISRHNFRLSDYTNEKLLNPYSGYLRKFELDALMSTFGEDEFEAILELGCGNGQQTFNLSSYGKSIIAIDLNEKLLPSTTNKNITFMKGDAQDLSVFAEKTFELVFSSNLLEHLGDISRCLSECKRVLMDSGAMVHSVPNQVWKAFNTILFYPSLVSAFISKVKRMARSDSNEETRSVLNKPVGRKLDDNMKPTEKTLAKKLLPRIHGISRSHVQEFIAWRQKNWIEFFDNAGLVVERTIHLPFYYGHGLNLVAAHIIGNLAGLSASTGYILRKK